MQLPYSTGCGHSVLPVRILEHLMQWFLVLKKCGRKLKPRRTGERRAWRALISEGGLATGASCARYRWMALEDSEWRAS